MRENNILLAEFLGLRVKGRADHSGRVYDFTVPNNIELIGESDFEYCSDCGRDYFFKDHCFSEDLLFHSDWNWLMLVVEKIESLETSKGSTFTIDFHRDSALIFEYGKYTNEIVFTEGLGRMQNLYNACIAFVKWYNNNK